MTGFLTVVLVKHNRLLTACGSGAGEDNGPRVVVKITGLRRVTAQTIKTTVMTSRQPAVSGMMIIVAWMVIVVARMMIVMM